MVVNTGKTESRSKALMPLNELLETYSQCLTLSHNFVQTKLRFDQEPDADLWEEFLCARADLFAFAETSFQALARCPALEEDADFEERRALTDKVLAALGEMAEMEDRLAAFLGQSLDRLKETIEAMQRSQPVFKQYGLTNGNHSPHLFRSCV